MAEQGNDTTALVDKFVSLIDDKNKSAEEIWNLANQLQQNDKSGVVKYTTIAAYAIADRDPKFKPQTMFDLIANNANQGYVDVFDGDKDATSSEIGSYSADVKALSSLAKNNPEIASSPRLLNTLNKISKETVFCYQAGKSFDKEADSHFRDFSSDMISAYTQCSYNVPGRAERALQGIANISKNVDYFKESFNTEVLNAVGSVLNQSMLHADTPERAKVAEAAFGALDTVSPEHPNDASKMLRLYGTIGINNPEIAGESVLKIRKIFNEFANNEEVQKQCLSQLQLMNNLGRGNFDEDTQRSLDLQSRIMKTRIDAEELKRRKGEETSWKTNANSQRRSPNTQNRSGNTYDR